MSHWLSKKFYDIGPGMIYWYPGAKIQSLFVILGAQQDDNPQTDIRQNDIPQNDTQQKNIQQNGIRDNDI